MKLEIKPLTVRFTLNESFPHVQEKISKPIKKNKCALAKPASSSQEL